MNIKRYYVVLQVLATVLFIGELEAKKHAVIVGIDAYPGRSVLDGPVHDAKNMYSLLVETLGYKESDIRLLLDKQATRNGILSAMESWLVKETSAGDDVLFYFSGHGTQVHDRNGEEEDGQDEVLVSVSGNKEGLIYDDEIGAILDKLHNRNTTVVIDACHSGTLSRSLIGDERGPNEKLLRSAKSRSVTKGQIKAHRSEESFIGGNKNREVWSAVSSWQIALVEARPAKGSVFTNRYVSGLKNRKADHNRDGAITRAELFDYITKESDVYCAGSKDCKTGLTPTLETSKDLYVENILTTNSSVSVTSTEQYFDQVLTPSSEKVSVAVLQGATLTAGQEVQIEVTSKSDGYLMLFDVRNTGEVVQLFPSDLSSVAHSDGRIYKNRPMVIPTHSTEPREKYKFFYRVSEPGSSGKVYAIVSEDKLPDNLANQKDLVVENPIQYVSDIGESLRQVWTEDLLNRQNYWSTGKTAYTVKY